MNKSKFKLGLFFAWGIAPIALALAVIAGNEAIKSHKPARLEQKISEVQAVERVVGKNEVGGKEGKEKAYKISDLGVNLIKTYERFSRVAYKCPASKLTIGYGHKIREGENYKEITEKEAEELLREDINCAENAVRNNVKVPLTQMQYDALCSFVYNIGEENFRASILLRKLNSRDYEETGKEFERWVYGGDGTKNGIDDDRDGLVDEPGEKLRLRGLENRREKEKQVFLGGK